MIHNMPIIECYLHCRKYVNFNNRQIRYGTGTYLPGNLSSKTPINERKKKLEKAISDV